MAAPEPHWRALGKRDKNEKETRCCHRKVGFKIWLKLKILHRGQRKVFLVFS